MKKLTVIISIVLLILTLAGCGSPDNRQTAGVPRRIVSISLDSDEILMGLVAPDRIAALSSLADSPVSYIRSEAALVPGRIQNNTLEEILSLHPDLVILSGWESEDFRKTLNNMGIRVYSYRSASKLNQVPGVIRGIAEAVGDINAGEAMISLYNQQLDKIRVQALNGPRGRTVYVWAFSHPYGSGDSFFGDMCRFLDIQNTLNGMDEKELSSANREFLILSNPDRILISDFIMSPEKISSMKLYFSQDPSLAGLNAVKSNGLIPLSPRVLYCPSQYAPEGLQELYQSVYDRPISLSAQ